MDFRRKPGYRPETGFLPACSTRQRGSWRRLLEFANMSFRFTTLTVALAIAFPVFAEELPVFVGDEIVVTPTRVPQKLSDTLAATTVITRREMNASGAIDLPTLLQSHAGVEMSRLGDFGAQAAIRLRGAEADHTLVLVDGLRMNSVSAGTTALEHLPLEEIERIEIVRGNVSSIYGSEAIGGVVRIFTRQGKGAVKPRLSLSAGTDDFGQIQASIGGELPSGLALHLGAGHTRSSGFSAVKHAYIPTPFTFDVTDADDDETRNTHFSLRLSQRIGDHVKVGVNAQQSRADVDYDGALSNHAKQQLAAYSAFVEGRLADHWHSKLLLGRSADKLDNDLNGAPADRYHTRIDQLHWENNLQMGRHGFRFGLEAQDQKLKSDQDYSEASRNAISAYAGVGIMYGSHDVDLSLRHDRYSDFGGHTTGRLAYGYAFSPAFKAHGALATAFKAPTFNDLYLNYPPFYFSNPNLEPEKSRSTELGLTYSAGGQFFQATLFASRTEDMIVIDPATFSTTVNLDEARNRGLELAWNGTLSGINARAALTLQNPEDANTGQSLLRRAQRFGSFALSGRAGNAGWRAELIASGTHPDVHVANFSRTRVPGYATLNLSTNYALAKDWMLSGLVANVLDAEYSLVHGYATPGRQFRLELSYAPN